MKPEERITEPKYQCPACRRWKLEAEYGPSKRNAASAGANAYCRACNYSYNVLSRSETYSQGDNTGDRRQIGPSDHRLLFTDFLNAFRPLGLAVREEGSQPAFEFKGVSAANFFAVAAHLHEEGIVLVWEEDTEEDVGTPETPNPKDVLYQQQNGSCGGCGDHMRQRNLTIDHIVPRSKGGSDDIENLQLLCQACNSMKGNRTQEYLMERLRDEGLA